jgi:4'-phosphopantetheinyl transferase
LFALPTDRRLHACVELWTRKEAVLKALGVGLQVAPRDVHVLPGQAVMIDATSSGVPDQDWHVQGFSVVDGYFAAVAVAGGDVTIPDSAVPMDLSD